MSEGRNAGKVMLVTGANAGMGMATVAVLADTGATVVLLCRDRARGEAALQELSTPKRKLDLMLCDLGELASIREFAAEFTQKYDRLDVLVNNAGVITLDRRETKDGLEQSFGVNHIGHFLLTNLLLPHIDKVSGRIVIVGSGAHWWGPVHFEDINLTKRYNVVKSYAQSKLANLLFARELARRLKEKGSGVTVNVAHPGAVATQMGVDRATGFGKRIVGLIKPLMQTSEQGARTAIYLALSNDVAGVSGEYFYRCRQFRSSPRSKDMVAAKRLWELSEGIVGERFSVLG